ncbi:Vegetative catalase [Piscirickettsia salmonis]|uniref:catalase n=1 Tax=Piscirickettsia salmonis TaxID=1238 RepID=UPI0012BA1A2B|nr:catalase [Piscirickettsia salmonis]QGP50499.1 Vegetative catalase [Piscirickettsia salmonis]QGP54279.1 Vegetative catalase [Piscirickettsia salmonis]QGP59824.1 Vegetative catalase [Piscirickettsia salmonis]QGP64525.1 Vegetative catalase [Piscirickettsia salmonis]
MTILTTSSGAPIADDQNSLTAGERGPVLLQDWQLLEKLAHFNRERIPERVVHAKGSGAYGTFTLTKSLSDYTIADYLQQQGEKTEVFLRFSTVGGEMGSGDAVRDPRGFAVKFYTREGNHDVVGNNTPIFFLRDPSKFPDFIHTQKRNPLTNLKDPEAVWDFWSLNPQSMHQITILMSDRGIPTDYRHMNGYGSHTFALWNQQGERFWVKWHFKTEQGVQCLTGEEAAKIAGENPDHAQEDLVKTIEAGDFPKWRVYLQIMPEKDAETYQLNPFDLTKVWPHKDYPLVEIGMLELNRNVENYFAEVEQSAFSPSNLVPGIDASPDKMLQARLFSYPDAHRYRIGANYNDLSVNCPHATRVDNYQRGGAMAGTRCPYSTTETAPSGRSGVNYGPNTKSGPEENSKLKAPALKISGDADYYDHRHGADDYSQAGNLYRIMSEDQKNQLVSNIAGSLSQASEPVVKRMLEHFKQCDSDYGQCVEHLVKQLKGQ